MSMSVRLHMNLKTELLLSLKIYILINFWKHCKQTQTFPFNKLFAAIKPISIHTYKVKTYLLTIQAHIASRNIKSPYLPANLMALFDIIMVHHNDIQNTFCGPKKCSFLNKRLISINKGKKNFCFILI